MSNPSDRSTPPAGESEGLLQAVVQTAVDGIITIDEKGRVRTLNPAAERIFGYAAAEVIGRNIRMLMPEPYRAEHDSYLANYQRTGERKIIGIGREVQGQRKDGSVFPLELAVSETWVGDRRIFTGIVRDITERKRAEEALRESEGLLRAVVETAVDGILTIDERGLVRTMNPAAERIFGYAAAEVAGRNISMLMPEPFHSEHDSYLRNYLQTGQRKIIGIGREVVGRRKDGSVFPMDLAVSETRLGDRRIFTGIVREISDRKRAEAALAESQQRLMGIISSATDAIITVDSRQRITLFNAAAERMFRCPAAEAIGQPLDRFIPPRFREMHRRHIQRFGDTGVSARAMGGQQALAALRADGEEFPVEATISQIQIGGEKLFTAILRDVTERLRAEEALRDSERRFRELADAMPQLVWTAGADGVVDYWNQRARAFQGLDRQSAAGWSWTPLLHADDLQRTREAWQHAVQTRGVYEVEHRLRVSASGEGTPNGEYRWFLTRAVPSFDASGRLVRWFGTATDIDDARRAAEQLQQHNVLLNQAVQAASQQLEDSHQRLRLAERMAALGTMSVGLGHDMGNLLFPLRAHLDALEHLPLPEGAHEHLLTIRQCANHLKGLSDGLRLMTHEPSGAPEADSVDLPTWWAEHSNLLRSTLPDGVELRGGPETGLPPVRISAQRLSQLILNLVQNAGDAMRSRGAGTVTVSAHAMEQEGRVQLLVADDGPGMTEEVRRRCLEPFYTTKTRGISTGMGLALVHGIVQHAGGTLQIQSQLGQGTTVAVTLPAAPRPPAPGPGGAPERPLAVVSLRDRRHGAFAASLLRSLGFEVQFDPAGRDDRAVLWLADADAVNPAAAEEFTSQHQGRRMVLLGAPPQETDPGGPIIRLSTAQTATLRDVLRRVAADCG